MIGKRRLQGNTDCDWMNPLSRKFKMNQSDVFTSSSKQASYCVQRTRPDVSYSSVPRSGDM